METNSRLFYSHPKAFATIVGLALLFLVLRVPVMYLQPGGQDEDCYSVPGWTILQTGLPQLPHVPARNPESVYYGADKVLYSEPPLYFYLQALFYALLPDSYGTARLSAACSGLLAAIMMVRIGLRTQLSVQACVWAFGLLIFSRWFYFPATSARPDILCTALGLIAIDCMISWQKNPQRRWLVASGVAIGFGGLTHPFALVYAAQLAVWTLARSRGWARIGNPLLLAAISILIAALWVPLILLDTDSFLIQFRNQFLGDHGEPLSTRFLFPWKSIDYHWFSPVGMISHLGWWQSAIALIPLIVYTIRGSLQRQAWVPLAWMALSSLYIMSCLVGPHHPVLGYWSYTACLAFLFSGQAIDDTIAWISRSLSWKSQGRALVTACMIVLVTLSYIPGAGLRTLIAHLQHRGSIEYDVSKFNRMLTEQIPEDAIVAVDTQLLLEFVLAKKKTLIATTLPMYFRLDQVEYDYVFISRFGIDTQLASRLSVELVQTFGNREDRFACYAELYRRKKDTASPTLASP